MAASSETQRSRQEDCKTSFSHCIYRPYAERQGEEEGGRKEGKEGRENEMKTTRFICRGRNYSLGLPPRNYICN